MRGDAGTGPREADIPDMPTKPSFPVPDRHVETGRTFTSHVKLNVTDSRGNSMLALLMEIGPSPLSILEAGGIDCANLVGAMPLEHLAVP